MKLTVYTVGILTAVLSILILSNTPAEIVPAAPTTFEVIDFSSVQSESKELVLKTHPVPQLTVEDRIYIRLMEFDLKRQVLRAEYEK